MAQREDDTQGIPVDRTAAWPYHSAYGLTPGPTDDPHPVTSGAGVGSPRRGWGPGWLVAALLLGLLGGVAGGYASDRYFEQAQDSPQILEPVAGAGSGTAGVSPVTVIANTVLPSVVFISVEGAAGAGVGSGFVVREDGYIVTNNHVIEGASEGGGAIQVELSEGEPLQAEIVGRDVQYDLAVLKVDQGGMSPLQFGDSDQLEVGEQVVAVGAPLGLDSTVTSGIVSAMNRPVVAGTGASVSYINAIQTDAAINPGNSGGPLLDMNGHVIGVNSAIAQIPDMVASSPSGSIGLGFAIPGNQVRRTAEQLIETGSSDHPIIGVYVDTTYRDGGARVLEEADLEEGQDPVADGGPADEAGIEPGDILLSIDGQEVEDSNHLIVLLRSHAIGDTVEIEVRSPDGSERTVPVTLEGSGE